MKLFVFLKIDKKLPPFFFTSSMAEMAIDFDSEEFKNQYPDYYNAKK